MQRPITTTYSILWLSLKILIKLSVDVDVKFSCVIYKNEKLYGCLENMLTISYKFKQITFHTTK